MQPPGELWDPVEHRLPPPHHEVEGEGIVDGGLPWGVLSWNFQATPPADRAERAQGRDSGSGLWKPLHLQGQGWGAGATVSAAPTRPPLSPPHLSEWWLHPASQWPRPKAPGSSLTPVSPPISSPSAGPLGLAHLHVHSESDFSSPLTGAPASTPAPHTCPVYSQLCSSKDNSFKTQFRSHLCSAQNPPVAPTSPSSKKKFG